MFESHQLLLQLLLLVVCRRFSRLCVSERLELGGVCLYFKKAGHKTTRRDKQISSRLTDDGPASWLRGRGRRCGGGRRRVGLGNQAEGELLVVVVGVVHYAQVHGKDGCGGGGHLHGQCCRAHVHWKRSPEEKQA